MSTNRFEQVDEPADDAITLSLWRKGEDPEGRIHCPAALAQGRLDADVTSDVLSGLDAYRQAIRLANEIKAPVVVMDPEGVWPTPWGELYREN